ncbi:hypothetical protein OUZ56_026362 [Daphnia magna]|uniref:Uncharacterized protein n=1 Tax=Daphnia magna TaxID=35525 RepID=A0ABQ9ZMW6_9CRUS|nr:hypothetical protein OUZ56_026362 [Daphnia magna]
MYIQSSNTDSRGTLLRCKRASRVSIRKPDTKTRYENRYENNIIGFLMSERFEMTLEETSNVHKKANFIALFHTRPFIQSRLASLAPAVDLSLPNALRESMVKQLLTFNGSKDIVSVIVCRCRRGQTNGYLFQYCLRDPSRRLHPLRELSSVPVETSPIPASSLESGTSFVGEALNFEGPIPKDHLTKVADSQGESVETSRGLYSDTETEVELRVAMSPVVPVGGQQFIVPSRHIEQPQRQAMEAVRKFISPPIF